MQAIRRIRSDEKGTILVFVAIALALILGMIALSFDLGRMAATQSELQSFADNVALAAAGELDGTADAITRAQNAARDMITDTQSFGTGGRVLDIDDVTLTFMSALDPDDLPPFGDTVLPAPYDAADAAAAAFVRVTIDPHTVPMAFASAFGVMSGGQAANAQVAASAVAGFTQYACDIAPLMFCQPSGGVLPGQMVKLHAGGNDAAWEPGNFGYLDITNQFVDPTGPCAGENGPANITRCLLGAQQRMTQCYNLRSVNTETGQRVGITIDPFNFRFDRFPNNMSSQRDNPAFAPAPNVIQGYRPASKGNSGAVDYCSPTEFGSTDTVAVRSMGLPPEACLESGTCGRFGLDTRFDGTERRAYVEANYGDGNLATVETDPHASARTRWEYYLAEIAAAGGASSRTPILASPRLETGRPMCSPNQSSSPERRVVVAAGVDCVANNVRGATSNLPVENFYTFFITQPVRGTGGNDLEIYGEVIEVVGGAGSTETGVFHDVVQLYR